MVYFLYINFTKIYKIFEKTQIIILFKKYQKSSDTLKSVSLPFKISFKLCPLARFRLTLHIFSRLHLRCVRQIRMYLIMPL